MQYLVALIFGIGWLIAIRTALNDFRVLVRGKIEPETNMTGMPVEQITGIAARPGFIRLIAALRLTFILAFIIAVPVMLIAALSA